MDKPKHLFLSRVAGVACCYDILENVTANTVLITSDEALFYLSGFVNQQTGQKVNLESYMKSEDLFEMNE